VSGFGRLCWEGLAVCLTGPLILFHLFVSPICEALGEGSSINIFEIS
jgi:hypothetical protein